VAEERGKERGRDSDGEGDKLRLVGRLQER